MDYNPLNVNFKDGPVQGDYTMVTLGPYDYWAIEYGYSFEEDLKPILDRVSEPELVYGTDEDVWGPDPLIRRFEQKEAELDVLDQSRGLGRPEDFYQKLQNWSDVLFLTSTSILNNSTEEILANVHAGVKTIMLGPSTPMVSEAFDHLPVHMLAGTVPIEKDHLLKAIRHGMGTPVLHKFSRKSYLTLR